MDIKLGVSAVATGTADVITATYSPAITLTDRRIVFLRALSANTITGATFNPDSLGASPVTRFEGTTLRVGDIRGDCILMYDLPNNRWELLTPKDISNILEMSVNIYIL